MIPTRGWWLSLPAAIAVSTSPAVGQTASHNWRYQKPVALTVTGRFDDSRLHEASGAAPSLMNPGLIWTISDGGNSAQLMAIDTTGKLRAVIPIVGAKNRDWESVAVGRCGEDSCVYIADVGDNAEERSEVRIYRLPEPTIDSRTLRQPARQAESLRVRYPDRPHDVEASAVTPEGDLLLVTKGRQGGVLLFTVAAADWTAPQPAVATNRTELPIIPQSSNGRLVTGMALDPTGPGVVIRSYRELFFFDRSATGELTPAPRGACSVLGAEPQGEGVAWLSDGRLLLVSEKGLFPAGVVTLVTCP